MQRASSRLYGMILLYGLVTESAYGQSQADIAAQQIQRQQQRERAQNEQAEEQAEEQRPAVRLPREPVKAAAVYPLDEPPCFPIRHIALQGDQSAQFSWALGTVADAAGLCLGSAGVNAVIGKVQNALIAAGYVTTRVLAAPQDLRGGELNLVLVPGRATAAYPCGAGCINAKTFLVAIKAGRDVTDTGGTIAGVSVSIGAARDISFNALQAGAPTHLKYPASRKKTAAQRTRSARSPAVAI